MEVRAVSKYLRISPRKARLVADLIRSKNVSEALTILKFTPKRGPLHQQDPAVRHGQCGKTPTPWTWTPCMSRRLRERGAAAEALEASGHGPGHPDSEAHQPYHGGAGGKVTNGHWEAWRPLSRGAPVGPLRGRERESKDSTSAEVKFGTEGTPHRFPSGRHQDVGFQIVCHEGLRQAGI